MQSYGSRIFKAGRAYPQTPLGGPPHHKITPPPPPPPAQRLGMGLRSIHIKTHCTQLWAKIWWPMMARVNSHIFHIWHPKCFFFPVERGVIILNLVQTSGSCYYQTVLHFSSLAPTWFNAVALGLVYDQHLTRATRYMVQEWW